MNNTFTGNNASRAGGAIYATHLNSTAVTCSESLASLPAPQPLGCNTPAWRDNHAATGYGNNVAYPPGTIMVNVASFPEYVSNGLTPLPMVVRAQDQASSNVTLGMLIFDIHSHLPFSAFSLLLYPHKAEQRIVLK